MTDSPTPKAEQPANAEPQTAVEWTDELHHPECPVHLDYDDALTFSQARSEANLTNAAIIKRIQRQAYLKGFAAAREMAINSACERCGGAGEPVECTVHGWVHVDRLEDGRLSYDPCKSGLIRNLQPPEDV